MTHSLTYLLSTGLFVGGLAIVAFFLMRYREKLQAIFGVQGGVRQIVQIAPHARLALVDIEGMTVLCGLGREGITTLEIVRRTSETQS